MPAILADENTLFVCYLLQNTPPGWDGSTIRLVDSDAEDEPVAVLSVQSCRAHTFGPPNEEAIGGHRLAKLGLEPFAAFEVPGSNWIADMERRNRVHPNHRSSQFSTLRHFIFTFHDSVLEFVSEGFEVEVTSGSIRANLRRLADSL